MFYLISLFMAFRFLFFLVLVSSNPPEQPAPRPTDDVYIVKGGIYKTILPVITGRAKLGKAG